MIKKIAWETFKNTGDINAFMELRQIENLEKGINEEFLEPQTFLDKTKKFDNKDN